jgi:hypothetical protein
MYIKFGQRALLLIIQMASLVETMEGLTMKRIQKPLFLTVKKNMKGETKNI